MRQQPLYTSWTITCESPERAEALQRWLAGQIDLERIVTDTIRATPGGVEQVQVVPHRLGDYFATIRLERAGGGTAALWLVFQRLPSAGRYWKDLMVDVLQQIERAPEQAAIALEYKGNQAPANSDG